MMCYYYDKSNETRCSVISDLSAFGIEECKCDSMCLSDDDDDNDKDDICNNKFTLNLNIKSNNVECNNNSNSNNNINPKSTNDNFISFCKNIQYKLKCV
jgi:hypothetical protein